MELNEIMDELKSLGSERTKKIYMGNGANEPLYGVSISAMKPLYKKLKINQELAEALYATGNYDAMYLAGMIAEPNKMTKEDFNRWIKQAYFYMISDFIVAVTLSESDIAFSVSDEWVNCEDELVKSAGYSCYTWLLGSRKDIEFNKEKLLRLLNIVKKTIHTEPNRAKYAMNNFLIAVGVSYTPLHEEALQIAKEVGNVEVYNKDRLLPIHNAYEEIIKQANKGRIGFKRKYVRC